MRTRILALKKDLKETASEIRKQKSERCADNHGFVYGLQKNQRDYRIKHIAYCLARGRTMEQIELKVRDENQLSKWELETIAKMVEIVSQPEEAI